MLQERFKIDTNTLFEDNVAQSKLTMRV